MFKSKALFFGALLTVTMAVGVAFGAVAASPNLQLTIPRVDQAPVIDGQLNDPAWVTASINGGKAVIDLSNTGDFISQYPRVGYVAYNADALYVAFVVYAPDANALVGDMGNWWDNDEIEVFLDPGQKGTSTQIGVTSTGFTTPNSVTAAVTKDGIRFIVELAIPWSVVNATAPAPGDKWGLNLTGHQVAAGDMWIAFNTTYGAFANPSKFAVVTFGE